jgi:hypothetical protein
MWSTASRVPAHVRQQRAPVDVANRAQPWGGGHAHVLVDCDQGAGLEPDGLDAEVLAGRPAAHRDQHDITRRGAAGGRLERHTAALLREAHDRVAREHLDAVFLQRRRHLVARELHGVRKHAVQSLDERDLATQRLKRLRQLDPLRSTTDDDETPRDLPGRRRLEVGPHATWLKVAEPLDRGHQRLRVHRQDHSVARLQFLVADHHPTLINDPTVTANQRDAVTLDPRDQRLIASRLGQRLIRPQQRLRGHARPVHALPADEPILDQRDGQPVIRKPPGRLLARRPAADDDHIEDWHASESVDRRPDRQSAWR